MLYLDEKNYYQQEIKDLCAITSLSILDHHQKTQPFCLNSWKELGLKIVCIQKEKDLPFLKNYTQVDEWIINNKLTKRYHKPTQPINVLIKQAVLRNQPILIINSDIAIFGSQKKLIEARDAAINHNEVTIGVRWNWSKNIFLSEREKWGLDAFLISPDVAKSFPKMDFGIGKPMWDYWMPIHILSKGFTYKLIEDRYFFHEKHKQNWNQDEWFMGANEVDKIYQTNIKQKSSEFRIAL